MLYARNIVFPIRYWVAYLAILLLVYFSHALINDEHSADAAKTALNGFIFIVLFSLAFIAATHSRRDMRWIFFTGALFASLLNIIDFFDHGAVFEQIDSFGVRAAAFYINANKAAEAILLGMILGIGVVAKKYRLIFCLVCLTGVGLTLSRGGLMTWFLVLLAFSLYQLVSFRSVLIGFGAAIFSLSFFYVGTNFVADYVDVEMLSSRIDFFSGDVASNTTQDDRVLLAKSAWDLFAESPLFGHGDYTMLRKGAGQLSHNQYLHLLSDHGVVGLFLYFLLLSSLISLTDRRKEHYVFLVFVLFWGLFSHNILDSYVFWMGFSYLAVEKLIQGHINHAYGKKQGEKNQPEDFKGGQYDGAKDKWTDSSHYCRVERRRG